MDKFKVKNKIMLFLIVLFFVSVLAGSIFIILIDKEEFNVIFDSVNNYFNNLSTISYFKILKTDLITNIVYLLIIWILGISIIGIPIILLMYFFNSFILGITITSIISVFKYKGILYSLLYIFPSYIANCLIFAYISMYALAFSIRLIKSLIKKEEVNLKESFNIYKKKLLSCLLIVIISVLVNTFINTNLLKTVFNLLNK